MENEILNHLLKFLSDHWTIIAGAVAVVSYLLEKIVRYYTNNKKKKEAYHKVFTGTIKFYFSYQKHRMIYQEEPLLEMPNEIYTVITKHLDTFNTDIADFKVIIYKETEVIPEIFLTTYAIFDIVDRFRFIDRLSSSGESDTEFDDTEKIIIRRAYFYALEEVMAELFENVIEEIRKRTLVRKSFTKRLFYLDSKEYQDEAVKKQMNLMKRYYVSLKRQGILSDEDFSKLIKQTKLDNKYND